MGRDSLKRARGAWKNSPSHKGSIVCQVGCCQSGMSSKTRRSSEMPRDIAATLRRVLAVRASPHVVVAQSRPELLCPEIVGAPQTSEVKDVSDRGQAVPYYALMELNHRRCFSVMADHTKPAIPIISAVRLGDVPKVESKIYRFSGRPIQQKSRSSTRWCSAFRARARAAWSTSGADQCPCPRSVGRINCSVDGCEKRIPRRVRSARRTQRRPVSGILAGGTTRPESWPCRRSMCFPVEKVIIFPYGVR